MEGGGSERTRKNETLRVKLRGCDLGQTYASCFIDISKEEKTGVFICQSKVLVSMSAAQPHRGNPLSTRRLLHRCVGMN